MGMFSNLLHAIMGHAAETPAAPATPASSTEPTPPVAETGAPAGTAPEAAPIATPAASVDMTAILDGLSAKSSEHLDWRKSIVDLLKLVDMDSSLSARKELAHELNYTGDSSDSAAMNVWLHTAVMKKLAENGGKVPADLLS